MELTKKDLEFIESSLESTRQRFEEYPRYTSYQEKLERLQQVDDVLAKVREMKRHLPDQ